MNARNLTAAVQEHWRWNRTLQTYLAGHPEPDGRTLLCFADGCGKSRQRMVRMTGDAKHRRDVPPEPRGTEEDRRMNETLQMASGDTLASMAVRSHFRVLSDRQSAVKHALEVGEILEALKEHAEDWSDWKWWHAERLMWSTAASDFYQWLHRSLPDVPHSRAMEVLSAPSLAQAAWLLFSTGLAGDRLQLPDPGPERLLRCVAGGGDLIIEAVPDDTETERFWLFQCDRVLSQGARRAESMLPEPWYRVEETIGKRLEELATDDVRLMDVPAGTHILAKRSPNCPISAGIV